MSNVDWSAAPEGAEFWVDGGFYKESDGQCYYWFEENRLNVRKWTVTCFPLAEYIFHEGFQVNPEMVIKND